MSQGNTANKTVYRIVTISSFLGDRHLQFKSTKSVIDFPLFWRKKEVECWRFIPTDTYAYALGNCLTPQDCPTSLPFMSDGNFLCCFIGHEEYSIGGLIPFAKQYPDIQKYFDELRQKRLDYLRKQKTAENAIAAGEIINLS